MFLARIVGGAQPRVYPLVGASYCARSWRFMSYERGAAAIAETKLEAIVEARREMARVAMRKLYSVGQ